MPTPILGLSEIFANQSGSDVFLLINQALRDLEIFSAGAVKSRSLTAPPNNPTEGDLYIPAPTATGDWIGLEDKVVQWRNGIWEFFTPFVGMTITSIPDLAKILWNGTGWQIIGGTGSFIANRQDLNGDLILDAQGAVYHYLNPGTATYAVILPANPPLNCFKYIVNRNGAGGLEIKENLAGTAIITLTGTARVAQCHYDGVEWEIIVLGAV